MSGITTIVVTHNSASHIGACLDSIRGLADVVVVDNASADASAQIAGGRQGVRLIVNPGNRGFAGAVNQGVEATGARLLLLLNPDTIVQGGLDDLARACEAAGLAAGRLLGTDGQDQAGFTIRRLPTPAALCLESLGVNRLWPSNPVNRNYRYQDRDLGREGTAEQPAGAFWMIRRDVFERLGGFDESFHPVWFEDVDFAKRAAEFGYITRYVPSASAIHEGGHSVRRMPGEYRKLYWYVSLLRYASKHFRTWQFRAVSGSVAAGCLVRSVSGIFGERKDTVVYGQVARIAFLCLLEGRLCSEGIRVGKWNELEGEAGPRIVSHPAQR